MQKHKRRAATTTTDRKRPKSTSSVPLFGHNVSIEFAGAAVPCMALAEAPFAPTLVALLQKQSFTAPSSVQAACWPLAVEGHDVIAISKT
eukprot:2824968-Prymnesium_polylepis.1